ncbi:MAG: acetylxylan esterase [Lachnospiraceae bacterium]
MPSVDMALEQLEHYNGTNPRPKDFWSFWDIQVKKTEQMTLSYEIQKSKIPESKYLTYYDLWFTGIGGSRIHAKYLKPKIQSDAPVMLQFHGYPGASRGWFEQTSWAGLGYALLAMDCPGQGGYSEDKIARQGTTASDHIIMGLDGPVEQMYYVQTFLDTCLMVRIAKELEGIDHTRICINGASQGAGLGLVCAALNHKDIVRCAALYPFLSDYKRAWDMDRDLVVYDGLRYYTRWFDPQGLRTQEIFTKLGYIDVQNFVERIECPVLFGTGLMDVFCPPSTQFAVYHHITAPKKHLIFPDYAHEEIGAFDEAVVDYMQCKEDAACLQ